MAQNAPQAESRRPTVADVALHAGVSKATVSQVLSGTRPVSASTRARVEASIKTLNFRPNQLARALRHQRSQTVAIVVPNITHVVYPMVARGVSEVLRPLGYQVAVYDTDDDSATESQIVRTVADRLVDGAVLFGYEVRRKDAQILERAGIAFVNGGLDGAPTDEGWDTVRVDQHTGIKALTSLAVTRHGPDIAYIGGPQGHGSAKPREEGFRDAITETGAVVNEGLLRSSPYSWQGGRDALASLLELGMRPRAVVCANDMIAIGAMTAAREAGLNIPGDIAISGFDNIDSAVMSLPPLTTVEAFPFEQGRACARLLLERMSGVYTGTPRHLTLAPEVLLRESL